METVSLANHFLIAMPAMADPNFSRTLTYICEHNEDGAIGIIVNRPMELKLAGLFDRVSIPLEDEQAEARFSGRCISAARCRPIAASCCTARRGNGSLR